MNAIRVFTLATFATASVALADDPPPPPPPPDAPPAAYDPAAPPPSDYSNAVGDPVYYEPPDAAPKSKNEPWAPLTKLGLGLVLGGGITDFIDDSVHDTVDVGPEWAARATIGTRSFIAGEAAYVGAAQNLSGLGLESGQLLSNGVEGLLRVNFTRRAIQPYIAGGLGWSRYTVVGTTVPATFDLQESTDVLEMPAAAGIAVRARGFIFDTRFNVGIPLTSPAFRSLDSGVDGTTWGVNGNVGFEF